MGCKNCGKRRGIETFKIRIKVDHVIGTQKKKEISNKAKEYIKKLINEE